MVRIFTLLAAIALTLASCGRQVTPDRTGSNGAGLQPGQMQIKVNTQGNVDFVNNWYVLPFDLTCTDVPQNCEPYAVNGNQNQNWHNWDFEMVLFQPNASSSVQVAFYQFVTVQTGTTTNQKTPVHLTNYSPQDLTVNPNCNGSSTQFCVTFFRRIFNGVQVGANPTPAPTNGPGGRWYVNFLVASPLAGANNSPPGQITFAPGLGGLNDQSFTYPAANPGLDVTTSFDIPWTGQLPPTWMQAASPSAQITGGEVINNP